MVWTILWALYNHSSIQNPTLRYAIIVFMNCEWIEIVIVTIYRYNNIYFTNTMHAFFIIYNFNVS